MPHLPKTWVRIGSCFLLLIRSDELSSAVVHMHAAPTWYSAMHDHRSPATVDDIAAGISATPSKGGGCSNHNNQRNQHQRLHLPVPKIWFVLKKSCDLEASTSLRQVRSRKLVF